MTLFEKSVVINRPVGQVFAHVTDLENEPKWHPGIVATNPMTNGPIGLGTKWREAYRYFGIRTDFVLEISEFELNRRVAFESSQLGPMKPRFAVNFEQVNDGTKVTYLIDPELRGVLKLLRPLLIWYGKRDLGKYFTKLKAAVESAG